MTDEQFAKGLGHTVGSARDLLEGEDKARAAEEIYLVRGWEPAPEPDEGRPDEREQSGRGWLALESAAGGELTRGQAEYLAFLICEAVGVAPGHYPLRELDPEDGSADLSQVANDSFVRCLKSALIDETWRDQVARASSLEDLLALLRADDADDVAFDSWMNLPTFGGEEPEDVNDQGIWSWDENRLLVGLCAQDMKIVSRPESAPKPEWPIATTLGAIRRLHPTWTDPGQTDRVGWMCDDLPVAIGSDGSVYLPDDDEISPPDPDFRGWAESERARLLQRIGSEV